MKPTGSILPKKIWVETFVFLIRIWVETLKAGKLPANIYLKSICSLKLPIVACVG